VNILPEDIFEKIFPKEKISKIKEKKEEPIFEEFVPKKTTTFPEKDLIEQKMNQINVVLSELDEKIKLLQEKIRNLEESASAVESSKKTKDFDTFAQEFYDKLNQIEEVRSQIFIQSSKMQTKYLEMVKRLDDVEYILEKMKSLERILPLIEKLKIFDEDIKLLRESIEKIKLSMVEQKFYSLIAIIPKVKEKEVLINLLDELDRTIEELKRNDMYRYDKMALSSEVLESQNVKELKLA
jgi:prefoldin subunit 5